MGMIGLLDWVPFVGPKIKAPLLMKIAKTIGFVAQPNIFSNREIVPEVKGILSAREVAELKLDDVDWREDESAPRG